MKLTTIRHYSIFTKKYFLFFLILICSCENPYIDRDDRIYAMGKIKKVNYYNMGSVEVEYFDKNNKKHSQQWSRNEDVKIGEEYWVAYNNKNFNEMNLFYTAPIIRDTSKYFEKKGIINWTYARKNKNETRFTYFFNGKKYIRYQSLVDNKIKKGDTVNILINRDKPSIAYVKGNSSITE